MRFHVVATIEYPNGVAHGKDQLARVRKNLIARLEMATSSVFSPVNVITMTVEAKPPVNDDWAARDAAGGDGGRRSIPRRCECELNHDEVGTHPAFHGTRENPTCQNIGTERVRSDWGEFKVCPPCANDAVSSPYYWKVR